MYGKSSWERLSPWVRSEITFTVLQTKCWMRRGRVSGMRKFMPICHNGCEAWRARL